MSEDERCPGCERIKTEPPTRGCIACDAGLTLPPPPPERQSEVRLAGELERDGEPVIEPD